MIVYDYTTTAALISPGVSWPPRLKISIYIVWLVEFQRMAQFFSPSLKYNLTLKWGTFLLHGMKQNYQMSIPGREGIWSKLDIDVHFTSFHASRHAE